MLGEVGRVGSRRVESRVEVLGGGPVEILSGEALGFVAGLHEQFNPERQRLLAARGQRQRRIDAGEMPDFLAATEGIRRADWSVAPAADDLLDRKVEITGPTDRKMMINALNSGARVFVADFEDATSPTWANIVEGQRNLRDAVRGTTSVVSAAGRRYELGMDAATVFVRPRGWHLPEKHVLVNGTPVSASLFDFGMAFFHNARELLDAGSGPYFYLPKIENHLEARPWNEVFLMAQERLGIPAGTVKATVLVENVLAAFEMERSCTNSVSTRQAQCRPVGLHLQLHRQIPGTSRARTPRQVAGVDDVPVKARLYRAVGLDPSPAKGARELFTRVAISDDFVDFLTLPAYELID